jgi:hypothetical protein
MKKLVFLLCFLALMSFASAKVGVVVEFPNGTVYTECVSVSDGKSAYDILGKSSLDSDWTDDGMWGRALCMIDGVGSEPSGDACSDWSSYWAFSLSLDGDNGWTTHSPVGFTAGGCWNRDYETPSYDGHYCAQGGDVIGFEYTDDFPSGYPKFRSFAEICPEKEKEKGPRQKQILRSSRPYWKKFAADCGIVYNESLAPQTLRRLCDENLRAINYAAEPGSALEENATNGTAASGSAESNEPSLRPLAYDYKPKVIEDFNEPFRVFFSSEGFVLSGLSVIVNGRNYTTSEDGTISFGIGLGDYLVTAGYPGFENLSVIFRIGG